MKIRFGYLVGGSPIRAEDPPDLIDQAVRCEKHGFNSFFFGNHFVWLAGAYSETFVGLTAAGFNTKKIMLCSCVVDPLLRHPANIAQTIVSIDNYTAGRAALGLGGGEAMNIVPYGAGFGNRYSRLKEAVEVIKLLWTSTSRSPANYRGRYFTLRDAYLRLKPYKRDTVPIYLAALRRKTREMAGAMADGFLPWINSPETFKSSLADVITGARSAGRDSESIDRCTVLPFSIAKDREKARKSVEGFGRMCLAIAPDILELLGGSILGRSDMLVDTSIWDEVKLKRLDEVVRQVPGDAVEQIVAYGTSEDVIETIDKFLRVGVTQPIMVNFSPSPQEGLKTFGERVIPYFRETYDR